MSIVVTKASSGNFSFGGNLGSFDEETGEIILHSAYKFYELLERFCCGECYYMYDEYGEKSNKSVKTIGDLAGSACACEIWVEDEDELINWDAPVSFQFGPEELRG